MINVNKANTQAGGTRVCIISHWNVNKAGVLQIPHFSFVTQLLQVNFSQSPWVNNFHLTHHPSPLQFSNVHNFYLKLCFTELVIQIVSSTQCLQNINDSIVSSPPNYFPLRPTRPPTCPSLSFSRFTSLLAERCRRSASDENSTFSVAPFSGGAHSRTRTLALTLTDAYVLLTRLRTSRTHLSHFNLTTNKNKCQSVNSLLLEAVWAIVITCCNHHCLVSGCR